MQPLASLKRWLRFSYPWLCNHDYQHIVVCQWSDCAQAINHIDCGQACSVEATTRQAGDGVILKASRLDIVVNLWRLFFDYFSTTSTYPLCNFSKKKQVNNLQSSSNNIDQLLVCHSLYWLAFYFIEWSFFMSNWNLPPYLRHWKSVGVSDVHFSCLGCLIEGGDQLLHFSALCSCFSGETYMT